MEAYQEKLNLTFLIQVTLKELYIILHLIPLKDVMISGKFDASTKTGLSFSGYLNDKPMNGEWTKGNLNGNYDFYKK